MSLRQRDKAILSNLNRFRCMTRDDIINLHFDTLKQPVSSCNAVMKRLRRDGHVRVISERQPYIYTSAESTIKKESAKIPHFLKIVDFYTQLRKVELPSSFVVEPKLGAKGTVEPDVFMIWRKAPFYVEVQRNTYSDKVFSEKMDRYETHYHSGDWKGESWQPKDKKYFPYVWIISETKYSIGSKSFQVFQSKDVEEFLYALKG